MLGSAIAAYLVLGGGDAAEAVGYANIPGLLLNLKNLNDGARGQARVGRSRPEYGPLVVSGFLTAALLGKVDALGPAARAQVLGVLDARQRRGDVPRPDKAMEAWGASIKGDTETNMLKLFAQFAGTFGLFALKLSRRVGARGDRLRVGARHRVHRRRRLRARPLGGQPRQGDAVDRDGRLPAPHALLA